MGSQSRDETQPMSDTATASLAGNPNGLSTMMPDLSSAGLPLKPSSMFQDLAYSPDNITFPKNLPSFYLQGALVERTLPQEFSPMAPHLQLKSQSAWPSPPLGPGDIDLDYCLKDGSLNGTGYGCSTSSPAQWASPLPTLYSDATQRPSQTSHPHLLNDICTPPPSTDLTMDQGDMIGPYSDGIPSTIKYTDMGACNALLGMEYPILDRTLGASRHSRRSSPTDMLASSSTPKNDLLALHSVNASPASSGGLVDEDKCDGEEPYARLIYRALMSRPNHAMTLQEMYQWFRENTSRAADEKGGWQNSIRHNLSMNAAFTKRARALEKSSPKPSTIIPDEPRRVMEWALEDWAVQDGVQSTTRYRKTMHTRKRPKGKVDKMDITRMTSAPSNPWAAEHNLKRAMSGRKGGRATKNGRLRKLGPSPPMPPNTNGAYFQSLPSPPRSTCYPFKAEPGSVFGTVHGLPTFDPYVTSTSMSGCRDYNALDPFQLGLAIPSMRQVMGTTVFNGQVVAYDDQLNHYLAISPMDIPFDLNSMQGANWQPPATGL